MIRWLKSLWAWRTVWSSGVWVYRENTVTGQRSAHWRGGCYGPLMMDWLRDGDKVYGPRGAYTVGAESERRCA